MGLGKTISCLAHICNTLDDARNFGQSNDIDIRRGKDGNPMETVVPLRCTELGRATCHTRQTGCFIDVHLPRHQPRRKYRQTRRIRLHCNDIFDTISRLYAFQKEYRRYRQPGSSCCESLASSQVLSYYTGIPFTCSVNCLG